MEKANRTGQKPHSCLRGALSVTETECLTTEDATRKYLVLFYDKT
jgi:hypothetical protein